MPSGIVIRPQDDHQITCRSFRHRRFASCGADLSVPRIASDPFLTSTALRSTGFDADARSRRSNRETRKESGRLGCSRPGVLLPSRFDKKETLNLALSVVRTYKDYIEQNSLMRSEAQLAGERRVKR